MKIIFLNALRGEISAIKQFILDQSLDTDVFCFQEAGYFNTNIFCQEYLLPQYQLLTDKKQISQKDIMVQATFINKNFSVLKSDIIGQNDNNIGLGLFTQIKDSQNKIFNLLNIHGFPWPGDKQDNPDRLRQSQNIIDFFKNLSGPKIIGGDFNLDFNTKSVSMFEDNGYRNLIKEFNIPTTRNEISWAQYQNKQLYADYVFVSSDVKVTNFSVPNLLISDHLSMILEIII